MRALAVFAALAMAGLLVAGAVVFATSPPYPYTATFFYRQDASTVSHYAPSPARHVGTGLFFVYVVPSLVHNTYLVFYTWPLWTPLWACWLEYAITATAMHLILGILAGVSGMALLLLGYIGLLLQWVGYLLDKDLQNPHWSSWTTDLTMAGWLLWSVTMGVVIGTTATTADAPAFVWGLLAVTVVFESGFGFAMLRASRRRSREQLLDQLVALSALAKLFFGAVLLGGLQSASA
jgi:hypothetical protein